MMVVAPVWTSPSPLVVPSVTTEVTTWVVGSGADAVILDVTTLSVSEASAVVVVSGACDVAGGVVVSSEMGDAESTVVVVAGSGSVASEDIEAAADESSEAMDEETAASVLDTGAELVTAGESAMMRREITTSDQRWARLDGNDEWRGPVRE